MTAIILDCEQGSAEWESARLGVATASMCAKILTPTGRLSSSRDEYVGHAPSRMGARRAGRGIHAAPTTPSAARRWSPMALAHYRFQTGLEARSVGFVFKDGDRLAGCSPDALVGDSGGLELKCPSPGNHLIWWLHGRATGEIPKKHVPAGAVQPVGDGPGVVGLDVVSSGPPALPGSARPGPEVAGRA